MWYIESERKKFLLKTLTKQKGDIFLIGKLNI